MFIVIRHLGSPLGGPTHDRRFAGFDDKILALYARGMTVREIHGFPADRHAVDVSPDLMITATDAVVAEVTVWQSQPQEPTSPVVSFVTAASARNRIGDDEGLSPRAIRATNSRARDHVKVAASRFISTSCSSWIFVFFVDLRVLAPDNLYSEP